MKNVPITVKLSNEYYQFGKIETISFIRTFGVFRTKRIYKDSARYCFEIILQVGFSSCITEKNVLPPNYRTIT